MCLGLPSELCRYAEMFKLRFKFSIVSAPIPFSCLKTIRRQPRPVAALFFNLYLRKKEGENSNPAEFLKNFTFGSDPRQPLLPGAATVGNAAAPRGNSPTWCGLISDARRPPSLPSQRRPTFSGRRGARVCGRFGPSASAWPRFFSLWGRRRLFLRQASRRLARVSSRNCSSPA